MYLFLSMYPKTSASERPSPQGSWNKFKISSVAERDDVHVLKLRISCLQWRCQLMLRGVVGRLHCLRRLNTTCWFPLFLRFYILIPLRKPSGYTTGCLHALLVRKERLCMDGVIASCYTSTNAEFKTEKELRRVQMALPDTWHSIHCNLEMLHQETKTE